MHSADTIEVTSCRLTHAPTITAQCLRIYHSYIDDVTNGTCQKLDCHCLTPIPPMVEELVLWSYRSIPEDVLSNCDKLKSLTNEHTDLTPESSNTLDLPSTLKKLRLMTCKKVDMLNFTNVTQLNYIGCDDRSLEMVRRPTGVRKPANFPGGPVSSGPNLWYRPGMLTQDASAK